MASIDPFAPATVPIPMTVLTGFLGAGKTTLLNRILNGDHGMRIAVLVNDFGAINIDAELVVGVESDVISLANGCVCCSIRDDLVEAVTGVIARPERPEYVVLEASGVADPSGIAVTFNDAGIRERIRVDSITCVMDAEQVLASPEQAQLKLWQVACSDLLVLNKVDLVTREQVGAITTWLDEHFSRYRLIEAERCDVPLEILLSSGRFDAARMETYDLGDDDSPARREPWSIEHARTFSAWSYETDRPLSLEALSEVASRLPASIYRCKGIIHSADSPACRVVLQVVGKRVEITRGEGWGERTPRTRIVAIGARGTVDGQALRGRFDRCVVASA